MTCTMGIDFSLTATGMVVLHDKEVFASECYRPKGYVGGERLFLIASWAVDQIVAHRPDKVCVESPFAAPSPAVLAVCLQLAELHGTVKALFWRNDIPRPWYVAPTTLKKYATGSGKGQKSDVKMAILKNWGHEFKDDNVADAYVLARIAGAMHGGLLTEREHERECLKSIRKSPSNELRVKGPKGLILQP